MRVFLLLTILVVQGMAAEAASKTADLAILNANIITLENQLPRAAALAVKAGRIVGVGNEQQVNQWISDETEIIDLQGATVLPGFIDTHVHLFEGASEVGGNCEMDPELNLTEHLPILKACARTQKTAGEWLTGYGFQLDVLTDDDHDDAWPIKNVLDEIFKSTPVALMDESSHAVIVNSKALEILGFSNSSPHPPGGRLSRDPDTGEPDGILFENAGDMAMELAWNSQRQLARRSYEGLLAGLQQLAMHGITTAGDGYMHWRKGWFAIWQKAHNAGELTARVSVRPYIYPHVDKQRQLAFLRKIQTSPAGQKLIVNQVKIYVDGVLHFGTAKVSEPYDWSWQKSDPTGLNYIGAKALKSWLHDLDKIGFGAHIHAIGDRGISQAINAVAHARKKGSFRDYGLTHLEMLASRDIPKFQKLNITADFQAGADFFAFHDWAVPYIGKARAKRLLQMRKVHDSGANVTFSSDWTVNELNPLVAIANSLRHKNRQGLSSVHDAIKAATINGAKALGLDKQTGSIKVGKSADLVVLSRDITRLPAQKIPQTEILMTILQGEIVFDIEDQQR